MTKDPYTEAFALFRKECVVGDNFVPLPLIEKYLLKHFIPKTAVREAIEGMKITKENASELIHSHLCKENPQKGNNHFSCSITTRDYFRNQTLDDLTAALGLTN